MKRQKKEFLHSGDGQKITKSAGKSQVIYLTKFLWRVHANRRGCRYFTILGNYSAVLAPVIPQGGILFCTSTVLEMKKDSAGMTASFCA
jgi:hypothetical protein